MPRIVRVAEVGLAKAVREAISVLLRGGIVVAPTDTLYGVLADATNPRAVERVYEAKRRPKDKPLPVLVAGWWQVERIVEPRSECRVAAEHLAVRYWPGPLTLILPAHPGAPLAGQLLSDGCVGVRVPDHKLVRMLAAEVGPLTGTSANISGRKPARTVEEAIRQLGDSVDLYIDGGPAPGGKPSTVLRLCRGVAVEREGPIPGSELLRVLALTWPRYCR